MEGIGNKQAANAEADAARVNSYIARTRAAQADTDARAGLNDELGNMRAALGQNNQAPNVGTFEVFRELREVRNRERRVEVGNRNNEARNFTTAANNAKSRASWAMPMAFAKAGTSMFDLYQTGA
jgi:hypothetical protein